MRALLCWASVVTLSLSFLSDRLPKRRHDRIGSDAGAWVLHAETTGTVTRPREISPYYRHDRNDNSTAPLPPPDVLESLLEDMWQAKQEQNTTRIRSIVRNLRTNYGIYIYDQPPIWTRQVRPPLAWWRKRVQVRDTKRKTQYGPRGHPLQRVVGEQTDLESIALGVPGDLLEPVIHTQLAQWMEDQNQQDPRRRERADAIRFELSLHGVYINASSLKWSKRSGYFPLEFTSSLADSQNVSTTDGRPTRLVAAAAETNASGHNAQDEAHSKTLQRIHHLLERYTESSMTGRHRECIFLSWELACCYGVEWSDRRQAWVEQPRLWNHQKHCGQKTRGVADLQQLLLTRLSSDGHLRDRNSNANSSCSCSNVPPLVFYQNTSNWHSPMYMQSNASLEMDVAILDRVQCLVQERIHKREESKYVEADAIREELWTAYRVGINDRLQQYSVGGCFDV